MGCLKQNVLQHQQHKTQQYVQYVLVQARQCSPLQPPALANKYTANEQTSETRCRRCVLPVLQPPCQAHNKPPSTWRMNTTLMNVKKEENTLVSCTSSRHHHHPSDNDDDHKQSRPALTDTSASASQTPHVQPTASARKVLSQRPPPLPLVQQQPQPHT